MSLAFLRRMFSGKSRIIIPNGLCKAVADKKDDIKTGHKLLAEIFTLRSALTREQDDQERQAQQQFFTYIDYLLDNNNAAAANGVLNAPQLQLLFRKLDFIVTAQCPTGIRAKMIIVERKIHPDNDTLQVIIEPGLLTIAFTAIVVSFRDFFAGFGVISCMVLATIVGLHLTLTPAMSLMLIIAASVLTMVWALWHSYNETSKQCTQYRVLKTERKKNNYRLQDMLRKYQYDTPAAAIAAEALERKRSSSTTSAEVEAEARKRNPPPEWNSVIK